jgi:hypothetical protein
MVGATGLVNVKDFASSRSTPVRIQLLSQEMVKYGEIWVSDRSMRHSRRDVEDVQEVSTHRASIRLLNLTPPFQEGAEAHKYEYFTLPLPKRASNQCNKTSVEHPSIVSLTYTHGNF